MLRRLTLAAAAAAGFATPLLAPPAAEAATLIQARIAERPARLVVDHDRRRVLVSTAGERRLVDLARGHVYVVDAGGDMRRFDAARLAPSPDGYRLDPWGPGPVIAGYPTTYHVVMDGARICAEVLVSDREDGFMADAMQALDLLQRLEAGAGDDPCAEPPFAAYAAGGWPIMAGLIDRALFETVSVSLGYAPAEGELALPGEDADALPTS